MSDQPKLLLNLSEAAELLGIHPSQLYEGTRARARARQHFLFVKGAAARFGRETLPPYSRVAAFRHLSPSKDPP